MADPEHKIDTDRNRAMLDKWHMRTLWGHYGNTDDPTEAEMNKRVGMVARYMLRMLSRGQIPNPDLVFDTLAGKHAPKCGTVGCFMDDWDHVH